MEFMESKMQDMIEGGLSENDRLFAENERLRDVLRHIDALDPEGKAIGCSADALRGLVNRMGAIARSALEQNKPETRISGQADGGGGL